MKFTITTTTTVEMSLAEAAELGREILTLSLSQADSPLLQAWLQATSQAYAGIVTQAMQQTKQQAWNNSAQLFWPWMGPTQK